MSPTVLEQLGAFYELAVGSGVVAALSGAGIELRSAPWDPRTQNTRDVIASLETQLDSMPAGWETLRDSVLLCGHLHGQTLANRWLDEVPGIRDVRVLFPTKSTSSAELMRAEIADVIDVAPDSLGLNFRATGAAANVDLAIVGVCNNERVLFVIESSLHLGKKRGEVPDLRQHTAWRNVLVNALTRRLRHSGFASLRTGVDEGVGITLPRQLRRLYRTIARNREVSKLYQGCAYATAIANAIATTHNVRVVVTVASTSMLGFEHLAAIRAAPGQAETTTWRVLKSCGDVYPGMRETADDEVAEGARLFDIRAHLRKALGATAETLSPDSAETTDGLMDLRVAERIEDHPKMTAALRAEHSAAIYGLIQNAPHGAVTVCGLLGAPGIGKTTSIRVALQGGPDVPPAIKGGWLYLYASPRISINDEQFARLAQDPGTCCLTANSRLLDGALAKQRSAKGIACIAGDLRSLTVNRDVADCKIQGKQTLLFDIACAEALESTGKIDANQRYSRPSTELVTTSAKTRTGVLSAVSTAVRAVYTARPDLERIVLALSLQALSRGATKGLDALLTDARKFRPEDPASQASALVFCKRFQTIVITLDEITGEEGSPKTISDFLQWLQTRLIDGVSPDHRPRIVVLLSDASLATWESFAAFLAEPKMSARVLVASAPLTPSAVETFARAISFGPQLADRRPCHFVRGDAYPAALLTVGYRIILTDNSQANSLVTKAHNAQVRRCRDVLEAKVSELLEVELSKTQGQVLCFLQDKSLLMDLRDVLVGSGVVSDEEVFVLTADSSPADRKRLAVDSVRNGYRLVLMTSSGTRGISFSKADRLVACLLPSAPEQTLMEFVQFAWRGRGERDDQIERHLEVMLVDSFTLDGEKPLNSQHRHADLAAFALTLRAALHTRMSGGYSVSPNRRVSVIPVGKTGMIKSEWHLQHLRTTLVRRSVDHQHIPLVKTLLTAAAEFFDEILYEVDVSPPSLEVRIDTDCCRMVELISAVPGLRACGPLYIVAIKTQDRLTVTPEKIRAVSEALKNFLGVSKNGEFSAALVSAARHFARLVEEVAANDGTQRIFGLNARAQVVIPIAAISIAESLAALGAGSEAEGEHQLWRDCLGMWVAVTSGARSVELGAQSRMFRSAPFAMVYSDVDPTDLAELGQRKVARAGLLANAIAGIVMHDDQPATLTATMGR